MQLNNESPEQVIAIAQRFLDNGLEQAAIQMLKSRGLKCIVRGNRIVDENDETEPWLEQFITINPAMNLVKDQVRKLAGIQDEVLIQGPTGTGKEILAHALHGKREGDFKALNCAGLPEQLIESELFGHVRGAFTGATSDKVGLMVSAKNGTLFLDEIGELPLLAQGKLLRVLQDKKIRRVGDTEDRDITCRFVFATNRKLEEMVIANTFRVDLYARISTFILKTTSLKDRPEDYQEILKSLGDAEIYKHLSTIDAPYNVRSLQQWVKRFKVLGVLPS
jgi:transcriptional regulator with PAS, ATPase and Fis domain